MTDQQILEKAIQRAIDGGWDAKGLGGAEAWTDYPRALKAMAIYTLLNEGAGDGYLLFIFNHDFAKALWGDVLTGYDMDGLQEPWKFHLQQMVIADDPIAYLGENI